MCVTVQARDGPLRLQARTDLWAGRGADDDNGLNKALHRNGAPRYDSGWRRRATPSRAWRSDRRFGGSPAPATKSADPGRVTSSCANAAQRHRKRRDLRGGWLHTGDVGALDAEGFLALKDRSKDVIISGGSNIYPREVEEILLGHPLVSEVAVVGEPDSEWGENVVAFVVAEPGAQVSWRELDAFCLEHIARFRRPKRYQFLDALPKNMTGKVLKTDLRKLLEPHW